MSQDKAERWWTSNIYGVEVMPVSVHRQDVERLEAERTEEQRIVNAQVSARISQLEDEKHRAIEAAADIGIEKRAFESVIDKTLKELKTRADRYDSDAGLANSERPSFAGSFLREAADLLRKKRDDAEPRQLDPEGDDASFEPKSCASDVEGGDSQ